MSDYKDRIYQSYRRTTSQNRYRAGLAHSQNNYWLLYERRLGRFLPSDRDANILDVACGSGEFLSFLKQKGFTRATGIDVSPEQVQAANAAGLDNALQAEAISYLTTCPTRYAVVSAFNFLEHLTPGELFEHLDAVAVAMKPGGVLLGVVPNAKGPFGAYVRYADITHELCFTPESILQIAAATGLEPVFIGECGPIVHNLVSMLRWCVWQMVRGLYLVARIAQAGDYRYRVYTQDLCFVLSKRA